MECGILPPRKDITRYSHESCPCLRPEGHRGEHLLYVKEYDVYIVWETDFECPCDDPVECEGDWCVLYGEVSPEEAQKLIASKVYKGKE